MLDASNEICVQHAFGMMFYEDCSNSFTLNIPFTQRFLNIREPLQKIKIEL